jgi:hypothetical protein
MVILKATNDSEKEGALPDPQLMAVEIRQAFEPEDFAPALSEETSALNWQI